MPMPLDQTSPVDPLMQELIKRQNPQQAQGIWAMPPKAPQQPQGQPQGGPPSNMSGAPNAHPEVPPAAARAANAGQLQQAYANNWQPNPMLMRAMMGKFGV